MPNSRRSQGPQPGKPPKKKRSRRWIGYTLLILLGMLLGGAGLAGAFVYQAYQDLPVFEEFDPSLTSVIYDRTGKKVYELADEENRTLVKIDQIPQEVQDAFIAIEDHRFYDHFGIDPIRFAGAIWSNIKYLLKVPGSQVEGGSTITMQLARNAFLTLDQTIKRKVQEMLIAVDLEKRYTKKQILEQYLNTVAFGGQAYGIEAAAQQYFSKHAKDLTLSEAALLAGILKGPSEYSPFTNLEGALERREIVLDLMVEHGYLKPERAEAVKKETPVIKRAEVTPTSITFNGDWYVDHVITILTDPEQAAKYKLPTFTADDLLRKGLKIHTALNLEYQKIAQETLAKVIPEETKIYSAQKDPEVPQGAVVIMDHRSGEVLALVGGLQHERMLGLNRATQARRDPGSTIKPLVAYLPAIDLLGWGPATVIDDSPPRLNDKGDNVWPENYEFRYAGLKPMRYGVEQSINAMAVRTLEAVTPAKAIEYGKKLGLPLLTYRDNPRVNDEHLALTLGGLSQGVTPMEMTAAYGVLGSLGTKAEPIVVTRIENKYGEIIWQAQPRKEQVVNRDSAWLMVDVMKGSITKGTASYEAKGWHGWPAAGKTGTTEEWHDAWFLGFTSEIVTGVWTGYDNEEGRKRLPHGGEGWRNWTGAGPPTKIWTQIMDQIYKEAPPDWERPKSIVAASVCAITGLLPSPLCPPDQIVTDWWRAQYVPKKIDDVLQLTTVVQRPWFKLKDGTEIKKYYLWQPGCEGTPETLTLIKRPTTWVKHPKDPNNVYKYWPADWWKEVPTDKCTPVQQPKPGTGTGSGSVKPPALPPTRP
ncbi:MAG: transglycosylase domain-containing protein [Bacillota bacterium]